MYNIAPSIRVSLPYPDKVDFQPTGPNGKELDAGPVPQRSNTGQGIEKLKASILDERRGDVGEEAGVDPEVVFDDEDRGGGATRR